MFLKPDIQDVQIGSIPPPKLLSSGRKLVTSEQRLFMKDLYLNKGLSTWKIGEIMGYLNVCVINNLRKAGVKLRSRSDANKILAVKRDYFDNIDTHTKAYLLGLFYADGNVHKDTFTIALQEPDKYLLDAIRFELGMTGDLKRRKPTGFGKHHLWALRIYDKEFCSHLRKWGVVPRKTSQLDFPAFLGNDLMHSFIHGLLDGDGCVYIARNDTSLRFSIAGSPKITKGVQKFIHDGSGIKMSWSATKNSRGTVVSTSGKNAVKILEKLYSESKSPFFLHRKKNKYLNFINES